MSDDPGRPPADGPVGPRGSRVQYGRAVAALASFLVLMGSGVAWATYQQFSAHVPHGVAVPPLAPGHSDIDGADQNILLLGSDNRDDASPAELRALATEADGGSANSDTMMIMHVPADGGQPTVVSFPRDSWVEIPGHGKDKLNAAYADGFGAAQRAGQNRTLAQSAGIVLTIKTLEQLTGLYIDHYVQVDLLGFYRISNAIGGVRVCLLHAQNARTDSDASGSGYSGIDLPAGWSTIKGSQALAFVRQRHGLPNGDLDRVLRQQYFLSAAFHKVISAGVLLNPFKLGTLMHAVQSSLLTDPTLDVLALARQFEAMSSGDIAFTTIPNDGPQLIYPDGAEQSIVALNTAAIPAFIAALHGSPTGSDLSTVSPAPRAAVTLDVLNGTDIPLLATANADRLSTLGFHVYNIDSATPTTSTVIEFPAGAGAAAKALSLVVPKARLVPTTAVSRVTLILGSDGVTVPGASAPAAPPGSAASGGSTTGSTAASDTGSGSGTASTASPAGPPAPSNDCIN